MVSMNMFPYLKKTKFFNLYDNSFIDFFDSFLTMFTASTPSNWFRIMHETAR